MTGQWWSWALTACGLTCLWLCSTGRAWPWLACAAGQTLWIAYGFVSEQYGFVASGVAYAVVQVAGWRNVRRKQRAEATA